MAMRNNDNSRCNCEKIFSKETLNCCCDKTKKDCCCEARDYKCCLKISPATCCGDKECKCNNKKSETQCHDGTKNTNSDNKSSHESRSNTTSSYNIRRMEATLKCCCEINGNEICCCSKILDESCCCIVTGKDECCCDAHSKEDMNDKSQMSTQTRAIQKTSIHSDLSMRSTEKHSHQVPEAFSNKSKNEEDINAKSTQNLVYIESPSVQNLHDNEDGKIKNPSIAELKSLEPSTSINKKPMDDPTL
ncbi:hypothetical protein NBO_70g0007 [Nosema bombycis CQ1]|uniref:Uncharacterized protein n=1 Tax=Nosema bombycis (strain CQ1 / CVCC 102059) TaxID=578461 RepID=R0M686_NOSB1|nr:hypothetical protein NBO_70g0007 [Nosema bombycis CQ1]|eukprot:EOB13499.1 hypothetical protein NBO_70g0007 [Nosema bombycis CQ1]